MGSLLKFFSLTYAVTWTLWTAAAVISGSLASGDPGLAGLRALLFLPGTVAPSVVALWLTLRAEGREGVQALLDRVFQWRVGARWYLFALGYMAVIKLAAALVHRVATGAWPRFGHDAWYLILAAIPFSALVQAGEEIGWRGYALPRLAARFGLGVGSLPLGVIWACWHLPLFLIAGTDTHGQSFPVYLVTVTALSVAMAWLYGNTRGSLLLVMLMHSAVNQSKDIVPSAVPGATNPFALSTSTVAWITAALLWVVAAYFLRRMPKAKVSRL